MIEADNAVMQMAQNAAQGQRFADDRVYAQFYLHAKKDEKASLEQGRPVFKEVPYIKIMVPGDKDNIVQRPVRDQDKQRFPRQWQAFQNNEDEPMVGTPLTEWAFVNRSQVEELKYFGIRTIEDLANAPDSQIQKFMGINALKEKAKIFLEDSKLQAPLDQLKSENEALRGEIENLKLQMQEISKPKPRRTRKKVDDEIQDGE
jgi:hypothetical protein